MTIKLIPWTCDDLGLIARAHGNPEMMRYLGGAQTAEQIEEQHERYLKAAELDKGCAFKIIPAHTKEAAGCICFWEVNEETGSVYEMGWNIFPEFQRQGLASAAVAKIIEHLKKQRRHGAIQAVPAIDNETSNALCKKFGFEIVETKEIEYPKGRFRMAHIWRISI